MTDKDEQWLAAARAQLDEGAEQLDSDTLRRLRQARQQALAGAEASSPWLAWAPGMAVASVALIVATLWLALPEPQPLMAPGFDELELMVDSQALEFYEDVDFYYWLAMDEATDVAS